VDLVSYYYRGNLAVEVERSRSTQTVRRTVKVTPALPTGEKLLYLFFILLLVVCVGIVGTRYIAISQHNHEIQRLKMEIRKNQEMNASLQLKIEQMSNRDRIEAVAQELGMVPQPGAVRVIGSGETIKETKKTN